MFKVEQAVNTPKGKAYVDEVNNNIVYVTLTNQVEMDFKIGDCQDWDEFKAEEKAKFQAEHDIVDAGDAVPTVKQRLALGQVMFNVLFANDPKGGKELTALAGELLLAKVKRTIAMNEKK